MRKYGDPAKVEAVLERVRMELAVYEASPTGARTGASLACCAQAVGSGGAGKGSGDGGA